MSLLLRKKNIIHLESEVNSLLNSGLTRFHYPIKLIYQVKEISENSQEQPHFKVIFIVPKRYLKKANKRNLAKRRVKEAFRINQNILAHFREEGKTIHLAFIYVSAEVLPFKQLESAVVNLITDLK
ncbi:MAG: ribonuclease P protein component [Bacteroidota bacterium]